MDKSIYRNVGGVVRNLAEVPRRTRPRSAQTALLIAGFFADGAAAFFGLASCIGILYNIVKGKK